MSNARPPRPRRLKRKSRYNKRLRRTEILGPSRPVVSTAEVEGVTIETLGCGHTQPAKPITGHINGRLWRRCSECIEVEKKYRWPWPPPRI